MNESNINGGAVGAVQLDLTWELGRLTLTEA